MKRLFTLLACCLGWLSNSLAQNPQFYKDGRQVVNAVAPFSQPSAHTQLLYTPASFAVRPPGGSITSIFFRNYNLDPVSPTAFDYLYITLIQTTDTLFSGNNFYTGGTQALYAGYYPVLTSSVSRDGWLEFPLTTAFPYDNTKSLVVDIKYSSKTNFVFSWADSTAAGNAKVCNSTSLTAATGTLSRQWNHFGMNVTPASACTSPPTAGTAVARHYGACSNNTYILDLAGNSAGTGQTYQWQTSATMNGAYTNVGTVGASSSMTITPTVDAWYRAAVTCSGNTAYSAPVSVGANSTLMSGSYTINSNQITGGTNFRSFGSAVDAMLCGIGGPVVFNVAPGSDTFFEQVTIPPIANTSPANTITFNGNGGKLSFRNSYYATSQNTFLPLMLLNGVDYLMMDSLRFNRDSSYYYNNSSTYYWGNALLQMNNDANNIIVQRCTFSATDTLFYNSNNWNSSNGVLIGNNYYGGGGYAADCDSITIRNNTFINTGVSAWGYAAPAQNKGNKILGNRFTNTDYYNYNYNYGGYGLISIRGQDSAVIEGNYVEGRNNYSIFEDLNCSNTLISKNTIIDTFGINNNYSKWGISVYGNNARLYNNVINLKSNYSVYGILINNAATSATVSNNTIRLASSSASNYMNGIYATSNTNQVVLKNNIIAIEGTSNTGFTSAIRLFNSSALTSNNNVLYTPNVNAVIVYSNGNVTYPTLAAWQAASGQDMNSYAVNPNFASVAFNNLRPTNGLIDDKGTPMPGVTDDVLGISRNTITPDIGAYEFGTIACPAPTNLAANAITATGATLSWTAPAGSNNFQYTVNTTAAAPPAAGTNIAGTSVPVGSLQPLTTYYLHVRTNCTGLFSQWVTIPFTTLCTTPSAAVTPGGPITLCNGTSVALNAPAGTGLTYQWKRNGADIPGATAASYVANQAGGYTVYVTMATCNALTAAPVQVTILPGANISAGGATTFCQGGAVTLSTTTGSGYTYTWQQGTTTLGGATGASYTATASGAYRAIVNNGLCSDTTAYINVSVVPYPSNAITPPGPVSFCDHQYIRLNVVLNPTYAYQWYRSGGPISGATSAFHDATQAGNYHAVISNGGCSVTTSDVSVTVNPLPVATADAVGNTVFCNNGSVNIRANQGANFTYQWLRNGSVIPGATGINYVASQDGLFSVVVSNGQCADTSAGVPVVFNSFPHPVITLNNGVLTTTTAFPTYQWHRNGLMIPFANSRTYTPVSDGNYVAVVGDTSGCLGSSNVITINSMAVGNTNSQGVSVYPNPATDVVYIRSSQPEVMVSITSPEGKQVWSTRCSGSLDISALAAGIYTLKITSITGSLLRIEKLVKVK